MKFVNIDLLCNTLSIQLLVNDSIIHIKKRRILKTEEEVNKCLKTEVTREKKIPIKQDGKKNSKASVLISGFVG